MDSMNIFISNASKTTGVSKENCDTIIRSMVKAVNNGALGGVSQMAALSRLKKKKFTTTNTVSDIVAEDTGFDREECKKVVGWMVDMMIQTMNRGGMPALVRMVNLMKKGQEATNKDVDYSEDIKDINDMLNKSGKEI